MFLLFQASQASPRLKMYTVWVNILATQIFSMFPPIWEDSHFDEPIFQAGWNHQLVYHTLRKSGNPKKSTESPTHQWKSQVIAKAEAQIPKGLNPDLVEEARFCPLEVVHVVNGVLSGWQLVSLNGLTWG